MVQNTDVNTIGKQYFAKNEVFRQSGCGEG